MSLFESLDLLPADPILNLPILFHQDPRKIKVNLGIGSYKTEEGKSWVLPSTREAEKILLEESLNKDYLPIEGDKEYLSLVEQLVLERVLSQSFQKRLFSAQSIGGTGALYLGAKLILHAAPNATLYLPAPTWPNHMQIFKKAGLKVETYPYYDALHHRLDFEKMKVFLTGLPPRSIVLLQGCCHNPTGVDPSLDQWKELSQIFHNKRLIPFFDIAYLGFHTNLEQDGEPIRQFFQAVPELFIAISFAKNLGLYGERAGALILLSQHEETIAPISSHVRQIIRSHYSSPPLHGARIVKTILKTPLLRKQWEEEINVMRNRMNKMRHDLQKGLQSKLPRRDFQFLDHQRGFFCYCGLNPDHVAHLRHEWGIYLPQDGRLNAAGLTDENISYVMDAFTSVLKHP